MTFLNIPQLERQGADIQSKVEELEEIDQSLRNRDKPKDDAISQLSDYFIDTDKCDSNSNITFFVFQVWDLPQLTSLFSVMVSFCCA